jgi:hypothetical protein
MCILSSSVPQQLSFSGAAKSQFFLRLLHQASVLHAGMGPLLPLAARRWFRRRLVADPGRRRAAARR